jgi:hypothetical protein
MDRLPLVVGRRHVLEELANSVQQVVGDQMSVFIGGVGVQLRLGGITGVHGGLLVAGNDIQTVTESHDRDESSS